MRWGLCSGLSKAGETAGEGLTSDPLLKGPGLCALQALTTGSLRQGPRSFETGKWCFVLLMRSLGFELESSQVSPDGCFEPARGGGRAPSGLDYRGLPRGRGPLMGPGLLSQCALLVAGAPNEGRGLF